MPRVFVTGSSSGLGLMAGELLAEHGWQVTLHARNEERAREARSALPEAETVAIGDLSRIAEMRAVAEQVNAVGRYDAVIHNVGVGYREPRIETEDGLAHVFAVNVLASYVLTALLPRPDRLVYLSSGMHYGGDPDTSDLQWETRRWNGSQAYSDSKLFDVVLALAIARLWPQVLSNAVEPGWVATRMGGPNAPDDLALGAVTQAWLASSDEPEALVSGRLFFHQEPRDAHPAAHDEGVQEALLTSCAELSGIALERDR